MPDSFRSPRKRALEIGTDSSKLGPDPNYDAQAGVPKGTPGTSGTYNDVATQGQPSVAPSPPSQPKPIK